MMRHPRWSFLGTLSALCVIPLAAACSSDGPGETKAFDCPTFPVRAYR